MPDRGVAGQLGHDDDYVAHGAAWYRPREFSQPDGAKSPWGNAGNGSSFSVTPCVTPVDRADWLLSALFHIYLILGDFLVSAEGLEPSTP